MTVACGDVMLYTGRHPLTSLIIIVTGTVIAIDALRRNNG